MQGAASAASNFHPVRCKDLRRNDLIRFERANDSLWTMGKVDMRAGKATGKYSGWWNVKNIETGHMQPEDSNSFESLEKVGGELVNLGCETSSIELSLFVYFRKDKPTNGD